MTHQDKADEFRGRAMELRNLAQMTRDPAFRISLVEVADAWDDLAARIGRTLTVTAEVSGTSIVN